MEEEKADRREWVTATQAALANCGQGVALYGVVHIYILAANTTNSPCGKYGRALPRRHDEHTITPHEGIKGRKWFQIAINIGSRITVWN